MMIANAFDRQKHVDYRRIRGGVVLDATGAGSDRVVVPSQYDYILERITVTAGANGLVIIYENEVIPSAILEVIQLGAAGLYSDGFSNNLFVPSNSAIIIACTVGGANGQMTYNLQLRQLQHA